MLFVTDAIATFSFMTMTELILGKYIQLVHFSFMTRIDENFFSVWLLVLNSVFGILHSTTRYISGELNTVGWVCPGVEQPHFHKEVNKW